ncbi:MAG: sigma 54-interacting transcriptional regulator, partial [Chitinivibrionales bacterium]|nr:sigma 54-interacting transcriptional regulator [Chitinivibrionales bacterium]
ALPDTLLESELFGYKAGAFTDAKKDKPGKIALAEGGTLFLDEIGDISAAMQAKLLRVLQQKTFEPLGDTHSVTADVRVLAATNKDLPVLVKEGRFREDFYYRINILTIKVPALRERRSDIPLLCEHFLERFNARYNKSIREIASDALDALCAYDFPGNIRQLENSIEHAFIYCKGETLEAAHLPPEIKSALPEKSGARLAEVGSFDELEKQYLTAVLADNNGNKLRTAEKLGIHKATLFRKMHRLGLS